MGFFGALTSLVESAVEKNGGKPAVIVAHSMGCLVSTYFLARKDADWLKKNIASFIALSAPFEGAVTALKGTPQDPIPLPPPTHTHTLQTPPSFPKNSLASATS